MYRPDLRREPSDGQLLSELELHAVDLTANLAACGATP